MRAGALRHFITIETLTKTVDSMGGFTRVWSEFVTARAQITPLKGEESIEHRKLEHENVHRIWIRYQEGITPRMRIVWHSKDGDRTMRIIGMRNPDERNRMWEIMAEEDTD